MAIVVSNVSVSYEDYIVLNDVNFNIPVNTITAIVGPNGAGKSTLLKAKLGLTDFTGKITFFGKSLNESRSKISFMSQYQEVDWHFPMTVLDLVLMGRAPFLKFWQSYSKEDISLVEKTLREVGMWIKKDSLISNLSGGQKQKVFLARSLVSNPDILFLDEPLAGIDYKSMIDIFQILKNQKANGKTIVIVHHNIEDLSKYFDNVVVVNKKIIDFGSTKDVLKRGSISKAFNN
ncbi:metal ABC transporter ATP-binding protein [bacterium]|jgi:ABC-type Mn2+/Zn2+ transport system ATPase subunit|nr:metal ABC transporter ATP-binding protein [bacterium]MBT6294041.1 metal ABC transporter ATP-binding protein [bacterium]